MKRKRSELEGRKDGETVGSNRAFLAALSTFSFPGMPVCPGAQIKVMGMFLH